MPNTDLVEVGPDDELFLAWCDVWAATQLANRPDEPPRSAQNHIALGRQLVRKGGSRDGTHRALMRDGAVVGALRLILPLQDNPNLAVVDVAVRPGDRRRGHGTTLLREGVRLAADAGRTLLIAEIDEPAPATAGRLFAERQGWTCDLLEIRRDLLLPVDEERLTAVESKARRVGRDYTVVEWRDRTPDALLDDRALLERLMTTDAPHGDLPVEEEHWDGQRVREYEDMHLARGRTVISAGALTAEGELVAFTDLQVPLQAPQQAYQGATLVRRDHRGHRLGALVKAAVLRRLATDLPQVRRISTTNAGDNAPMVALNDALGFQPAGHHSTWSFRL